MKKKLGKLTVHVVATSCEVLHAFPHRVDRFSQTFTNFWGLMKTPLLSSAGFVCLRVRYREVFWEEFSRLT